MCTNSSTGLCVGVCVGVCGCVFRVCVCVSARVSLPSSLSSAPGLLHSFVLRFASTHSKPAPVDGDWMPRKLHEVGCDILSVQRRRIQELHGAQSSAAAATSVSALLAQFFADNDTDKNGYLELSELKVCTRPPASPHVLIATADSQ